MKGSLFTPAELLLALAALAILAAMLMSMFRRKTEKCIKKTCIACAEEFGFLPGGDPAKNTAALQKAVDLTGTVRIDRPGIYDISGEIQIGSNTELVFGAGVFIRRQNCRGYTFVNKGAFTRTFDENIRITGLNLIVNGCDITEHAVIGLRAHVAFLYAKNIVVRDLVCRDLGNVGYCIQICTFENAVLENLLIEGGKDAVHFGRGSKFAVRHGVFRTYDDPVALNAYDYVTSNPEFGWIEDGVIEDCYDLDQPQTTGFFCRLLSGAWCDWKEGMPIRRSDLVVHEGKLYGANLPLDGVERVSKTAPTHDEGVVELDGIPWKYVQPASGYSCGVRNVTFRNIFLEKKRQTAFCFSDEDSKYARSIYPGSEMPVQSGIVLENIITSSQIGKLVVIGTSCDTLKIVNSVIDCPVIVLAGLESMQGKYPVARILLGGNTFLGNGGVIADSRDGRPAELVVTGSLTRYDDPEFQCSGDVRVKSSDVRIKKL